jgi:hypothetical protein
MQLCETGSFFNIVAVTDNDVQMSLNPSRSDIDVFRMDCDHAVLGAFVSTLGTIRNRSVRGRTVYACAEPLDP